VKFPLFLKEVNVDKKTVYIRSCSVNAYEYLLKVAKDLDCSLAEAFYQTMKYLEDSKVKFKKEIKVTKKD